MNAEKVVLNVKEIAEMLSVSQDTIYTMVREQQIPFIRLRRRILFYRERVDRWLQDGENE